MIVELTRGPLQTLHGEWQHVLYWDGNKQAIALVYGDVAGSEGLPIRVHSSCITAHVFLSTECDCREQFEISMAFIQSNGKGVIVWLDQEGRDNGMMAHIASQLLKRQGMTQSDAYEKLGYPTDARHYEVAAEILQALGIKTVRILTNNPKKIESLRAAGLPLVMDHQSVMIKPTNEILKKQYRDKIGDGHLIAGDHE